jgi:DeoR/GlpR family transcriptional regulator of sugar metabolism
MKRRLRQRQILELLQVDPELSVEEACERLGTSPATVRREFVQLAREGRVEKTWGGIRAGAAAPGPVGPPAFAKRLAENATEKRAIAEAAAALLKDGDVVMIDGGTTTYQLCEHIAHKRIRIITNSLVIAQAVDRLKGRERGAEIYLTGGILEPESSVLSGPPAEAFLKRYHANWAFLSAAGVDAREVTNYNEAVLASERLMIEQSDRVALIVDHTKMGRRAMCLLCPLGKVDHIFTGDHPAARKVLRAGARPGLSSHLLKTLESRAGD